MTFGKTYKPGENARCCYLLESNNPRYQNKTYIGVSISPFACLDQHNGVKYEGVKRTESGRPWELVLIIDGFPSDSAVLKFEWLWQHFDTSRVVRKVIGSKVARMMKSQHGTEGNIAMLKMLIVNCPQLLYESSQLKSFFFAS